VQPSPLSPEARQGVSYSHEGPQNRKRRRLAGVGVQQAEVGEELLAQDAGAEPLDDGLEDRGPSSSNRTSTHNGAPLLPGSR
jgi:hypothetical protein